MQALDAIRHQDDLSGALKFERNLLRVAKENFELISPLEFIDLERLQLDRNRCAHPSLTADDHPYAPPAELARLHIHSAVTHLLQHPPAQGKFALERLLTEIDSDYFPSDVKKAMIAFRSGPLSKPRPSLVRNLLLVLIKRQLKDAPELKKAITINAAIGAILELHPQQGSLTLEESLSNIFRGLPDDTLHAQISFVEVLPISWEYLDADIRQRLENYVKGLPSAEVEMLPTLLQLAPLRAFAIMRVNRLTIKEVKASLFFNIPQVIADHLIKEYLRVESFDAANAWGTELKYYVSEYSPEQIEKIVKGAGANNQISESFMIGSLIKKMREAKRMPDAEFDLMVVASGLGMHIS